MYTRRLVVAVVALCTLFVSIWMPPEAVASEGARGPVRSPAEMTVAPMRIDWSPRTGPESLVLTVAGPGDFYFREEFPKDQSPSLSIFQPDGKQLPDGIYTYELRRLAKPPQRPLLDSGYLTVRGGSFVTLDGIKPRGTPSDTRIKPITAKQVVTGYSCIGDACGAGDDNFSVLKLKSALPWILFDDVADGFSPVHDWAIQVNDSIGSGEYFAIQDRGVSTFPFTIQGGAPDSALYLRNNGNLGLGTSTPAQDIHVMSGNTPTLRMEQDTSGGLSARTWDVGANHTELFVKDVTNSSSVPFRIKAGAPADSLVVASSGRVGIGTASPTSVRLDVRTNVAGEVVQRLQNSSAAGWSGIEYLDNNGNVDLFFGVDNSASTTRLNSMNNNPIVVLTNSTERMRVTAAGDVGIGTSSPSSKLHVNGGDIRVSGGSFIDDGVTLNAPDYVFEPSYSLMPLAELREFVSREKHLPNVPAATDIKKEGLNVSQFQMRLLEKVEELALYALKQEEDLRSLRDENLELKARLEALEKAQASTVPK